MLADTSGLLVSTEHNTGHLVHGTFAVDFIVVDREFYVFLLVDRGVVVVLAFGTIADLIGVLVRIHHVDVVLVWHWFLVPRCCFARVLGWIVSEIKVVGLLKGTTSEILHQSFVLWIDVWVLPSKLSSRCGVVYWLAVTELVVGGLEVVRWWNLLISLSALVVLGKTRVT